MKTRRIVTSVLVFVLASMLLMGFVFGSNTAKTKKMEIFGDFTVFISDGEDIPFIKHSKDNGITVYKMDYDAETFEIEPVYDDEGNQVVSQSSDKDFIENLNNVFCTKNACNLEVTNIEGVTDLFFGISVGEISGKFCTVTLREGEPDETTLQLSLLTPREKREMDREDIAIGSIFFMDEDFNYACYKYTGDDLVLYEQKALNPDIDYGNNPALSNKTIPNEWHWSGNTSKGYLWVKPFSDEFYAGGVKGHLIGQYKLRVGDEYDQIIHPKNENDPIMVDASWFIKMLYGVETYDSEHREPRKSSLYMLKEVDDRTIETIKLQIEEDNKTGLINDEIEYEFSKTPYNRVYAPLFDLCDIFKINYHYRPFDHSVLIERFR